MNRRQFLKRTSAAAATLAAATYIPTTFAAEKTRRVGLIGAGWYGKSDLWRLVQVEPVEIVPSATVDKQHARGRSRDCKSAPEIEAKAAHLR